MQALRRIEELGPSKRARQREKDQQRDLVRVCMRMRAHVCVSAQVCVCIRRMFGYTHDSGYHDVCHIGAGERNTRER